MLKTFVWAFQVEHGNMGITATASRSFIMISVLWTKQSNFTYVMDYFRFFWILFKKMYYLCKNKCNRNMPRVNRVKKIGNKE